MPVRKVTGPRGGKGYQYGTTGKYYPGPGGKARAEKQGEAIRLSEQRATKKKK
jgi:hypothetical protein